MTKLIFFKDKVEGANLIILIEPEGNNCTVVQVLSNSAVNFFLLFKLFCELR